MCVIKLYKTDKEMSDADFTTHENDEFTEEVDWENGLGCIAQPLVSHDFVLIKFATKKTVKYFIGLIQETKPIFWTSDPSDGYFVSERLKTLQQ